MRKLLRIFIITIVLLCFETSGYAQRFTTGNISLSSDQSYLHDESIQKKCELILSATKGSFQQGEIVVVTVTIKNISMDNIKYDENRPSDIIIDVTRPKNNRAEFTLLGKRLLGPEYFFNTIACSQILIKPSESYIRTVWLNRLFDLSEDGKYKIQVTERIGYPKADTSCEIKTNLLEIEMVETDHIKYPIECKRSSPIISPAT